MDFRAKKRRRVIALALALGAAAVAVFVLTQSQEVAPDRQEAGLRFEDPEAPPPEFAEIVNPDAVDPKLVTRFDTPVVVTSGDGNRTDRIVLEPDPELLPAEPGAVVGGVARAGNQGRLVLVGPPGWLDDACVLAQVTTPALRPLASVHFASVDGACGSAPVGDPAEVICAGDTAVIVAIDVPQGEVGLPEGGSGFADAVRMQLVGEAAGYETVTVRGTVDIADDATVDVPEVGGPPGAEITVVLGGAGARATCTFA